MPRHRPAPQGAHFGSAMSVNAALGRVDFLQVIVQGAAASVDHLPWLKTQPDTDMFTFALQLGNLSYLVRARLDALSQVLRGHMAVRSCHPDFAGHVAHAVDRIESGGDPGNAVHDYLRHCFVFDHVLPADVIQGNGIYRLCDRPDYAVALDWLMDTLSRIESGQSLDAILGNAHNNDVFTRLFFDSIANDVDGGKTFRIFHPVSARAI